MTSTIGLEPKDKDISSDWDIQLDIPEIAFLKKIYSHIDDEEFNVTLRSAANILSQCPNPKETKSEVSGLAIGKVQSGKTLSFTTLIALAAGNGYSKIIVLAGTKNALLKQTHDRLKRDLGSEDPERAIKMHVYPNPTVSNSTGIKNTIRSGKCALIVVLKHAGHINNVIELITSPDIPSGPTLIIDDEGDEASLNNYFRRGEESSTYRKIKELRSSLPVHAYIAYTATPQANLLLSAIDLLAPDFCELIEPGKDYCGGSTFFGDRVKEFVRPITDIREEDDLTSASIPESLKESLAIFFVGAAIRHTRFEGQKHSMLIHMTERTAGHKQLTASIKSLLTSWTDSLALRAGDPARIDVINRFKKAYEDLSTTIKKNIPSWEEVEKRLLKELQSYEPHMVNSLHEGIQIAETTFQHENNIVIGGNILGRGVTIKELTVSYLARRARKTTNVDTMEQRARWFGYKSAYLNLCRIYLRQQIISDYRGILRHEDDFWDSLQRNIRQGIPICDWPRFFKLDSELDLNPTRSSVAQFYKFKPVGWEVQTDPILDPGAVKQNKELIDGVFKKAKDEKIGGTTHKMIKNCEITEVLNLLRRLNIDEDIFNLSYFIEYFRRLSTSGKLKSADLVYMNRGEPRERTLLDNGKINQLMQGRNAKYPGDREFHNDKVQIQFHNVDCIDKDKKTIPTFAVAIYVPNESAYDMSYVVRGEI
jgi:hypothetical protein